MPAPGHALPVCGLGHHTLLATRRDAHGAGVNGHRPVTRPTDHRDRHDFFEREPPRSGRSEVHRPRHRAVTGVNNLALSSNSARR